jgi:superfamily II DNA or RNA helicase
MIMENIIFTYDKDLTRKNGQFTVVLTPAIKAGRGWKVSLPPRIFFVKDLESVASKVPDKTLFRMALESEMAFRKNEGRFFQKDEEFTRLRVSTHRLIAFAAGCMKRNMLVLPGGAPAAFRLDREVVPEIEVVDGKISVNAGGLSLDRADLVVKTVPVTVIGGNAIVQLRQDIPFSLLNTIPAGKALAEDELNRLLVSLSGQTGKLRIVSTGTKQVKVMRNAAAQPVVDLDERAVKARLYFSYQGNLVKDNDEKRVLLDMKRHLEIHRNRDAEEKAKDRLSACGFAPRPELDYNWRAPDTSLEALVPFLEKFGFAVRIGRQDLGKPVEVRWKVTTEKRRILVGGTVISGGLHVGTDGLFQAFQEGKRYVERSDGSLGIISDEIWRVLSDLSSCGSVNKGAVSFDKADFARVRRCLETSDSVDSDPSYTALCGFANRVDGVKRHNVPEDLGGILRPYQVLGFNWLRTLRDLGVCGILADDMGLGKSLQVLAMVKSLKEENALKGPVLLIVPKTLLFNWQLEINKFAPDLQAYAFTGTARIRNPEFLEKHHLILTSYGLLRSETPLLCSVKWDSVILDEAHAVKNAETLTAKAVKHIPSTFRLSITGTPVENSASDLWSQFDFLMPGFLGDLASFRETYPDGGKNLEELRERTQPFVLRRLKSQVLAELPPKTDVTISSDFTDDQKNVYDKALASARDEIASMEGPGSFKILRLILRLRQIACHPLLAVKSSPAPLSSGKTEDVFHAAMEILSEGHKILVFSQFTTHLRLIEELFLREKIPTFYLDGRTRDRAAVVSSFKAHIGPCLFFISLKTGVTGLNLSEASYVFLLDPWWNPAVENQAVDRCHRIGQYQPVTVYRFITRGSIEEKVNELKALKSGIESSVVGESSPGYIPFDEKTLKGLIV